MIVMGGPCERLDGGLCVGAAVRDSALNLIEQNSCVVVRNPLVSHVTDINNVTMNEINCGYSYRIAPGPVSCRMFD